MKVDIRRNKPISLVDEEDIQKKRQRKLTQTTTDEWKTLQTFGIAKKVKKKKSF